MTIGTKSRVRENGKKEIVNGHRHKAIRGEARNQTTNQERVLYKCVGPQKRTSIKTSSSNREMSDETREKAQGRKGYDQLEQPDGGALNQRFKKGASLQATLTECRMDTRR